VGYASQPLESFVLGGWGLKRKDSKRRQIMHIIPVIRNGVGNVGRGGCVRWRILGERNETIVLASLGRLRFSGKDWGNETFLEVETKHIGGGMDW
jgi:hypothetical protein